MALLGRPGASSRINSNLFSKIVNILKEELCFLPLGHQEKPETKNTVATPFPLHRVQESDEGVI